MSQSYSDEFFRGEGDIKVGNRGYCNAWDGNIAAMGIQSCKDDNSVCTKALCRYSYCSYLYKYNYIVNILILQENKTATKQGNNIVVAH